MDRVPPTLKRHVEMQQYRKHYGRYLRHAKRLAARKPVRRTVPVAIAPPVNPAAVQQEKRRRIRDLFRRKP